MCRRGGQRGSIRSCRCGRNRAVGSRQSFVVSLVVSPVVSSSRQSESSVQSPFKSCRHMSRCCRHAALVVCLPGLAAQTRPNIVLIVADDLGYGDLGSYGAPDIKTPNLDRLAREGVRLTDFYANAPVCTPTRAGLMSGRYQQRVRLERPIETNAATPATGLDIGLPATGRSLPQILKNAGYATGLVGKWHLGFKPEFQPNRHGFDYFWGYLAGYVDWYAHVRGDGQPDLWENATAVQHQGYLDHELTKRAVTFIGDHASRPFFLEVSYGAPHWPFQSPHRASTARSSQWLDAAAAGRRESPEPRGLCGDGRGYGRRHRPHPRRPRGPRAHGEHPGRLHERQRRRVAVAQRPVLPSQGHRLGGRHPRAGDRPLADGCARGTDAVAGRRHHGPQRHLRGGCGRRRGRSRVRGHRSPADPSRYRGAGRADALLAGRPLTGSGASGPQR